MSGHCSQWLLQIFIEIILSVLFQNGSTAHDVAVQQGHQVVAELLSEYERRMRKGSQGDDQGEKKKEAEEPQEAAAAGKIVLFQSWNMINKLCENPFK